MYIPPYYKEADFNVLLAFIQQNSFGILCSSENGLKATHIPFVAEERNNKLVLTSHLAKANPQGAELGLGKEVLVIFNGPHAYISPGNYEHKQNVPTWNYIAVHAYGVPRLIEEEAECISVLEKMIGTYEPAYKEQWSGLSPDYVSGMVKGIIAFEMEVTKLDSKFKLSQNKTAKERERIAESLGYGTDPVGKMLGEEMKKRN